MPECKCSTYPFEPKDPCYNICTGRVLNYARPDELVAVFRLPPRLVERIRNINQAEGAITLLDYRSGLTMQEFTLLNDIFSSLHNNKAAILWLKENMQMPAEKV